MENGDDHDDDDADDDDAQQSNGMEWSDPIQLSTFHRIFIFSQKIDKGLMWTSPHAGNLLISY